MTNHGSGHFGYSRIQKGGQIFCCCVVVRTTKDLTPLFFSGLTLVEIGNEFGHIKYSTVSNVVRRIEGQLSHSNQLSKMVAVVRQKLQLEQRKT